MVVSILLCIDGSHGALVRRNMWIHKYRDDMVPTVLCIIFSIIKHAFLNLEFKSSSLPFCFFSLCLFLSVSVFFPLFFFCMFFSLFFSHFFLSLFFFSSLPPHSLSLSLSVFFSVSHSRSLFISFPPLSRTIFFRCEIGVIFSNLKALRIYMMDVVCWTLIIWKTTGS